MPQLVHVELDAAGRPAAVQRSGAPAVGRVETVIETWRIDDEWWRDPIARRYVEVVLEGGGRMVVFEDLATGRWFMQKP